MKKIVDIIDVAPMTDDCLCGYIQLSNGVKVWFGLHHEIATYDEAQDVANIIIHALNAEL